MLDMPSYPGSIASWSPQRPCCCAVCCLATSWAAASPPGAVSSRRLTASAGSSAAAGDAKFLQEVWIKGGVIHKVGCFGLNHVTVTVTQSRRLIVHMTAQLNRICAGVHPKSTGEYSPVYTSS